jgi:F-box protein 45
VYILIHSTNVCAGFSQGRHAWEVMWEGPLGTVAVVGIATKEATLQV